MVTERAQAMLFLGVRGARLGTMRSRTHHAAELTAWLRAQVAAARVAHHGGAVDVRVARTEGRQALVVSWRPLAVAPARDVAFSILVEPPAAA